MRFRDDLDGPRPFAQNARTHSLGERVEQQDVERIARKALKELGVTATTITVVQSGSKPGVWRIDFGGDRALQIMCGSGTTPQWVRQQIFEQFLSR